MDDKKAKALNISGQTVYPSTGEYANGRLAIVYMLGNGEKFATLTVNLPDEQLEEGEFFVKTWSENERISNAAIKSGYYIDTGKRVKTGFVEAQIWRFAQ